VEKGGLSTLDFDLASHGTQYTRDSCDF